MATNPPSVRIGVFGANEVIGHGARGCGLWEPGYEAALTAAGAIPVMLGSTFSGRSCEELFGDLHGLVYTGNDPTNPRLLSEGEAVCAWCKEHSLPLLAVNEGMQILNLHGGGSLCFDLPREMPEALQHRHPPEKGLRHAIMVEADAMLAKFYGEGEIVVNSEHRRAVLKVARGFRVGARALDGVVESIEFEGDRWFAMGVQWHPASESASGLDIQLFRGLVEACQQWVEPVVTPARAA